MKPNYLFSISALLLILLLGSLTVSCSDESPGEKNSTVLPQSELTEDKLATGELEVDSSLLSNDDEHLDEEDCIATAGSAENYEEAFQRCIKANSGNNDNNGADEDFGSASESEDEECLALTEDSDDVEEAYQKCVEEKVNHNVGSEE